MGLQVRWGMQERRVRQGGMEFRGLRGTWAFLGLWGELAHGAPTESRAQQVLQARLVFQDALDTTGRSDGPVLLGLQASWVWGVYKAILAWKAGTVPWEARAPAPSTELPVCPVPQDPSELWERMAHLARMAHLVVLAQSVQTARMVPWACRGCQPCTGTGRISGGLAPLFPTSRVSGQAIFRIWIGRGYVPGTVCFRSGAGIAACACERELLCSENEGRTSWFEGPVMRGEIDGCRRAASALPSSMLRSCWWPLLSLLRRLSANRRQDDLRDVDGGQAPEVVVVPAQL
jgi:hypothetical protein